jgi:EpsI family protein
VSRPARFGVAALALLAAAGALTLAGSEAAPVPLAAPLELLPAALPGWSRGPAPPPEALPPDPRAARQVTRGYAGPEAAIWVAVGYYPSQREGARPAARDLLFPRAGWSDLSERTLTLPVTAAGSSRLPANVVIMRRGEERLAILYWYVVQRSAIASDHWYRARVAWNRLARGRADGALVRVASPVPRGSTPESVMASQARFLEAFYPELLRSLPQ